VNLDGILLQASEAYGNEVIDRHYGALWRTFDEQAAIRSAFTVLSPRLAVREWSSTLAGTGLAGHHAFWSQAETFRRRLVEFLNHYLATHSRTGDWAWKAGGSLWAEAPEFRYIAPSLSADIRSAAPGFIWMAALLALAAAAAGWATSRVRPTR
jgi:ABC-2 type transport system permease protein